MNANNGFPSEITSAGTTQPSLQRKGSKSGLPLSAATQNTSSMEQRRRSLPQHMQPPPLQIPLNVAPPNALGAPSAIAVPSSAHPHQQQHPIRIELLKLFNRVIEQHNNKINRPTQQSPSQSPDRRKDSHVVGTLDANGCCSLPSHPRDGVSPVIRRTTLSQSSLDNAITSNNTGKGSPIPPIPAGPGMSSHLMGVCNINANHDHSTPLSARPIVPLTSLEPIKLILALENLEIKRLPQLLIDIVDMVLQLTYSPPYATFDAMSGSPQQQSSAAPSSAAVTPQLQTQRSFAFDPMLQIGSPSSSAMKSPWPPSSPFTVPFTVRRNTLQALAASIATLHNQATGTTREQAAIELSGRQHSDAFGGSDAPQANPSVVLNSCELSSCDTSLTSQRPTPKITRHANRVTDDEGFTTLNNYVLLEEAGRGKFGKVCVASLQGTSELRAIKIIPKRKLRQRWHQLRQFPNDSSAVVQTSTALQREVAIMKRLRHKNVVPLYEVIDDPDENNLYLVMKYVDKGPIVRLNADGVCSPLDVDMVRSVMRQVVSGVAYLHKHRIAHRDIKPDNILLGEDGKVYLSDFGTSYIFERNDDYVSSSDGTPAFACPEMVRGDGDHSVMKADVWALGVTMYALLFGLLPFRASSIFELNEKIVQQEIVYEVTEEMDHECDYDEAIDLIKCMMERDVTRRYSIEEVQRHAYLMKGQRRQRTFSPEDLAVSAPSSVSEVEPTEEEIRASFTPLLAMAPTVPPSGQSYYRRDWATFDQ